MIDELQVEQTTLDRGTARVRWSRAGAPISVQAALEACRDDAVFRERLIGVLRDAPYAGYFWEHPPITRAALARPFELVLVDAPGFARVRPEPNAFAQHFARDDDGDGVVVFENLGRDATLVVPCPIAAVDAYTHLAAFVRSAPRDQVHALLRCAAGEALARASARPLWLSTAGMGVYWLHVRLDSRPKYYRHTPYTVHDPR
jgi:hypothetical protein